MSLLEQYGSRRRRYRMQVSRDEINQPTDETTAEDREVNDFGSRRRGVDQGYVPEIPGLSSRHVSFISAHL